MSKRFMVTQGSFIASQLVAPGSILTEADLLGSTPGSALVEIDGAGAPVHAADLDKLRTAGINFGPVQVAPLMPHAPNPTRPQAVPGQPAGAAAIAGDREYVPAAGVEDVETAAERVARLEAELVQARTTAAAVAAGDGPVAPTRRGGAAASASPLDGSIPDLEKHLATLNDPAGVAALREAEVAGKNRSGALAAIDDRAEQLNA